MKNLKLFIILLFILAMSGCRKDFEFDKVKDLTWNPDLALQLVNDSITLRKILTQEGTENRLIIDETGDISILYYYNNDAFRLRPNDLIKLQTTNFTYQHTITQAEKTLLANGDLTLVPVPYMMNLSGSNQDLRIDKFSVRKGRIHVTTGNTFSNAGYLTVTFPDATSNGNIFSVKFGPVRKGFYDTTLHISNVLFDLSSSPNTLRAEVGGLLKQSLEITAGDEILANFSVTIDTVGTFEGFLGRQTFPQMEDTVIVDVFNNAYALGEVSFIDPQATITFVNSIGIPAMVTVQKMVAINEASAYSLDIADRLGAGSEFQIPSPVMPLTSPSVKTMTYTNENTGNAMYDFFNVKPDRVSFQIQTVINPTGKPLNFFTDTSSFYGDLRVKLPLWGHFDNLTYQDTFDLVVDKPEEIEHLEFKTHLVNGMPMYGLLQVYFADEDYNIKDSLAGADKIFIREAPVDPSTNLPYPGMFGTKDTTYILDAQRMQNFENVRKMLVKGILFTPDDGKQDIKLRADQSLVFRFSARAKFRTTIQPGK